MSADRIRTLDADHLWHPYGAFPASTEPLVVDRAAGTRLVLSDGRELVDGMSSWWAAVHGYRHPVLDAAVTDQLAKMSHVMFGGLTHAPAARLAELLVDISPEGLDKVFLADSGSVSVEVAVKIALQYQRAVGRPERHRLLTWRGGYHGDTLAPMSVCDPEGGMHAMWTDVLARQVFAPAPPRAFDPGYVAAFESVLTEHAHELAGVIVEPVVQGAGGMRFHDPAYLRELRRMCDEHGLVLIFDEIATGFGRTGEMFAADHAGVAPDLMCVGKALTGGYLTLAAVLCTTHVAETISAGEGGGVMHGPTFMAQSTRVRRRGRVDRASVVAGLAGRGGRSHCRARVRAGAGARSAGRDRRAGARRNRGGRNHGTGRHAGGDRGGGGGGRLAAAVPESRLHDAAVRVHAGGCRRDHRGCGRCGCHGAGLNTRGYRT